MRDKKILYIDMDGVIANFEKAIHKINPDIVFGLDAPDIKEVDQIVINNPRIFTTIEPIEGSIQSINKLKDFYEIYFLSSPMWEVPESFMDKRLWIHDKFGDWARKRLILSHQKDLNIGDYLVDDRTKNGAGNFKGYHILFGSPIFKTWNVTEEFLMVQYYKDIMKNVWK